MHGEVVCMMPVVHGMSEGCRCGIRDAWTWDQSSVWGMHGENFICVFAYYCNSNIESLSQLMRHALRSEWPFIIIIIITVDCIIYKPHHFF